MRVANWAMGSSGFAITGPPPVRDYRKVLGSPAGARTTRGVACTRIRQGAAPGTGSAAVRGGRSEQNVSLTASAPLLHVSRRGDSWLARRQPGEYRRRARLLMRPAASSLRKPRTGPSSHSDRDRLVQRYRSVSAALALVVVAALALRWALADFLLDQFGSLPDSFHKLCRGVLAAVCARRPRKENPRRRLPPARVRGTHWRPLLGLEALLDGGAGALEVGGRHAECQLAPQVREGDLRDEGAGGHPIQDDRPQDFVFLVEDLDGHRRRLGHRELDAQRPSFAERLDPHHVWQVID